MKNRTINFLNKNVNVIITLITILESINREK